MLIYTIEETLDTLEGVRAELDRLEVMGRSFNSYEMNRVTTALLLLREIGPRSHRTEEV